MRSKALVFDLDDTLIDTKLRHYQVLKTYILSKELQFTLTLSDYCSRRRSMELSNLDLLKLVTSNSSFDVEFKNFWEQNIESAEFLKFDTPIVNEDLLLDCSLLYDIYILSLRNNSMNANIQLKTLPFASLIKNAFFIKHNSDNPKINELIRLKYNYDEIVFIGDTKTDKEAAMIANVDFVLVQSGIYKVENILSYTNVNSFLKSIINC